ncbi:MAG TPA: hypothetical protein VHS99_07525 [Chloroflexota bacterium]|jgi:hypothetical protein|nr:hypothetical protein [Chloroflexota bacterium]
MTEDWGGETDTAEAQAARVVAGLVRVMNSEEAYRLLGVDGTLEDELDVMFLSDPLAWVANEIATGIRAAAEDEEGASLSTVLAMLRLYRIVRGTAIDERELLDAVLEFLSQEEEEK